MKLKFERTLFRVLRFLLILLVLILFIVGNRFFLLLEIDEVYNEKKTDLIVYASDSIQQERLPVSLEVGRIYF